MKVPRKITSAANVASVKKSQEKMLLAGGMRIQCHVSPAVAAVFREIMAIETKKSRTTIISEALIDAHKKLAVVAK